MHHNKTEKNSSLLKLFLRMFVNSLFRKEVEERKERLAQERIEAKAEREEKERQEMLEEARRKVLEYKVILVLCFYRRSLLLILKYNINKRQIQGPCSAIK